TTTSLPLLLDQNLSGGGAIDENGTSTRFAIFAALPTTSISRVKNSSDGGVSSASGNCLNTSSFQVNRPSDCWMMLMLADSISSKCDPPGRGWRRSRLMSV